MLLVVSGQTAGVGVDYSAADEVFFYNEPWTEYERRQQLARSYRPGLEHPLRSRTFIVEGTIEEGIHKHIQTKYKSVEKLLRGIPITELEQEMLISSDQEPSIEAEVNPELAKFYFSAWERMMKIFSHVREIGEEDFKKFLDQFAREYADCYLELGSRSYQANANRVSGALIDRMMSDRGRGPQVKILDAASGPEMLRRHAPENIRERIVSMDINAVHFETPGSSQRVVGSYLKMPFENDSFDYANLALAWHYTNFVPSQGKLDRLQMLQEMNRVLKPGGRTVINMIYSLELGDPDAFDKAIDAFGFRVVKDYSGEVVVGETYKSKVLVLEKTRQIEVEFDDTVAELKEGDLLKAFKFKRNDKRLRDSRGVITEFSVGGKDVVIPLNKEDRQVFDEEQETLRVGRALKKNYGSIEDIPRSEIIDRGFTRIHNGKRYVLFHRLKQGGGAVVVK
jgi:ubiquinone/menaquinone biosynthesis C-methylase UbiE